MDKITPPPMPKSEYGLAFWDEGGMQDAHEEGFTADQLTARDQQWRAIVKEAVLAERDASFRDALRVARGCADYGGGYRGDTDKFEAYQHGIQTVIRAISSLLENGLSDTQVAALHRIGANHG